MATYDPVPKADSDPTEKGRKCRNCGNPGYDHRKRRTNDSPGERIGFTFECPDVDPEGIPGPAE